MKILTLTFILILNVFIAKSQCDYTNYMLDTVEVGENICFTQDVTITHVGIVNYGTININNGVTVTFTDAVKNIGVGKFKLMGCDSKIDISGGLHGIWQGVDIERYCSGCTDAYLHSGSSVDIGYLKATPPAYVNVSCQTLLPVELISYSCNKKELIWSTGSEINSDYFTILYSDNGIDFTSVTNINAQGNSFEIVNYSYPINKKGYYKLTQTDYDGTTEEFSIKFCGPDVSEVTLLATYDVLGQIIQDSYRGIVIEVYSDGTTKRIYKR